MNPPTVPSRIRPRRSILFCPGSRPERFAKAFASGADVVCLELEDGVAPEAKDRARDAVIAFLMHDADRSTAVECVVRVNDPRTDIGRRDVDALAALARDRRPAAVMVPKVDGPEELEAVARVLGLVLLPMIETARGLERVAEIADAGLALGALVFGGMDLAAELGARFDWEPLLYARSRIVHAAALAGVAAIDVPWAPLDDVVGLQTETRRVARLGFTGKLAIHPMQVPLIHAALAPDADELAAAHRIVDAADRAAGGVLVVDGRMVDRPVVLAARRVLARAGAFAVPPPA